MKHRVLIFTLLLLAGSLAYGAVVTVQGDTADTFIGLNTSGTPVVGYVAQAEMGTGDDNVSSSKGDQCSIVVFQLPNLGGQTISNANLAVTMSCGWPNGTDPFPKGVDLYAIRCSTNPAVLTNDYGFKGSGPGTLIQNNVMTMPTNGALYAYSAYNTDAAGDTALASWLSAQYTAGALPGSYVFFRYALDANTANPVYLSSANSTTNPIPELTIYTGSSTQTVATTLLSQHGITWLLEGQPQTGQYANGDYWVVAPAKIIGISNNQHIYGFSPSTGMDGSEINPGTDTKQGYDSRMNNYQASRNRSLPNGSPISASNSLVLNGNESLVSAISWIPGEPGCPAIDAAVGGPRPSIYSMAILTCVTGAPPAGAFRPPYCGSDKAPHFNVSQLRTDKLPNLAPVASMPVLTDVENHFKGPWVDHVRTWIGGHAHPYIHMPNYGRDLSLQIGEAALLLLVNFDQLPGSPSHDLLLTRFVQLGIDLAGIADNGGGWPNDGGHAMGRKWPILFAGVMLDDAHMQSIGQWTTDFQEDMDTFYVAQTNIDITHSAAWNPDIRAAALWPYETTNIGVPEWGIRHKTEPNRDQLHWSATYRDINNLCYPSLTLPALIMGQRTAWNHEAFFDYTDRAVAVGPYTYMNDGYRYGSTFAGNMWRAYRASYPPQWVPYNTNDYYSPGQLQGVWDNDNDGLPNDWEILYFGGATNANPSALASNRVNTVYEAYIAGINPTDPTASFGFSNDWKTLHWNTVSGRVYGVWWSTNLTDGFQPLETNMAWPRNSWTGQVNGSQGGEFYQLKVELAP